MAKSSAVPTVARRGPRILSDVDCQFRWLIYLYLLLLVFEGALRKWFLPGLSDALLLARDPVVLLAYALAFVHGRFPTNGYVISGALLALLYAVLTTFFGHGDLFVTLFGVRTNFLHFPFAFLMGNVLNRDDVIRIGRWWLWGTLGMTAVIVLQFYSPDTAWINRGVGGEGTAGFSGALGRSRPPATFSFIVGTVLFFTTSAAFLVAGLTQHDRYSKTLLALASGALLIAVPVSISRSLIIFCVIVFATGVVASSLQSNTLVRWIRIGLIALVALFIVSKIPIFDEAREAFLVRWERSTGEGKGGFQEQILGRVIGMFTGPFEDADELPILGYGVGAGTQVGTKLLTGEQGFSLGESEWYRIVGESGVAFGLLFIAWRVLLCFKLLSLSLIALSRGNGLGLIFLSATALNLITGQLGQTTIYGFTVIGIGLTIASMRVPERLSATNDQQDHA